MEMKSSERTPVLRRVLFLLVMLTLSLSVSCGGDGNVREQEDNSETATEGRDSGTSRGRSGSTSMNGIDELSGPDLSEEYQEYKALIENTDPYHLNLAKKFHQEDPNRTYPYKITNLTPNHRATKLGEIDTVSFDIVFHRSLYGEETSTHNLTVSEVTTNGHKIQSQDVTVSKSGNTHSVTIDNTANTLANGNNPVRLRLKDEKGNIYRIHWSFNWFEYPVPHSVVFGINENTPENSDLLVLETPRVIPEETRNLFGDPSTWQFQFAGSSTWRVPANVTFEGRRIVLHLSNKYPKSDWDSLVKTSDDEINFKLSIDSAYTSGAEGTTMRSTSALVELGDGETSDYGDLILTDPCFIIPPVTYPDPGVIYVGGWWTELGSSLGQTDCFEDSGNTSCDGTNCDKQTSSGAVEQKVFSESSNSSSGSSNVDLGDNRRASSEDCFCSVSYGCLFFREYTGVVEPYVLNTRISYNHVADLPLCQGHSCLNNYELDLHHWDYNSKVASKKIVGKLDFFETFSSSSEYKVRDTEHVDSVPVSTGGYYYPGELQVDYPGVNGWSGAKYYFTDVLTGDRCGELSIPDAEGDTTPPTVDAEVVPVSSSRATPGNKVLNQGYGANSHHEFNEYKKTGCGDLIKVSYSDDHQLGGQRNQYYNSRKYVFVRPKVDQSKLKTGYDDPIYENPEWWWTYVPQGAWDLWYERPVSEYPDYKNQTQSTDWMLVPDSIPYLGLHHGAWGLRAGKVWDVPERYESGGQPRRGGYMKAEAFGLKAWHEYEIKIVVTDEPVPSGPGADWNWNSTTVTVDAPYLGMNVDDFVLEHRKADPPPWGDTSSDKFEELDIQADTSESYGGYSTSDPIASSGPSLGSIEGSTQFINVRNDDMNVDPEVQRFEFPIELDTLPNSSSSITIPEGSELAFYWSDPKFDPETGIGSNSPYKFNQANMPALPGIPDCPKTYDGKDYFCPDNQSPRERLNQVGFTQSPGEPFTFGQGYYPLDQDVTIPNESIRGYFRVGDVGGDSYNPKMFALVPGGCLVYAEMNENDQQISYDSDDDGQPNVTAYTENPGITVWRKMPYQPTLMEEPDIDEPGGNDQFEAIGMNSSFDEVKRAFADGYIHVSSEEVNQIDNDEGDDGPYIHPHEFDKPPIFRHPALGSSDTIWSGCTDSNWFGMCDNNLRQRLAVSGQFHDDSSQQHWRHGVNNIYTYNSSNNNHSLEVGSDVQWGITCAGTPSTPPSDQHRPHAIVNSGFIRDWYLSGWASNNVSNPSNHYPTAITQTSVHELGHVVAGFIDPDDGRYCHQNNCGLNSPWLSVMDYPPADFSWLRLYFNPTEIHILRAGRIIQDIPTSGPDGWRNYMSSDNQEEVNYTWRSAY